MATQSPNLGLTLPIGSENVSRQIINDNNLIIDGAVESNSEALAIVINGDTAPKAITSGQYLFIKNHTTLPTGGYHATANIANGAAITSSNVAQDADGIANALNGKIAPYYMYYEISKYDGTYFPCSKAIYFTESFQMCIPARNAQTGALYILWYDNSGQRFRIGSTISGSAPSVNQTVVIYYPVSIANL